jgi:hypothetical protein
LTTTFSPANDIPATFASRCLTYSLLSSSILSSFVLPITKNARQEMNHLWKKDRDSLGLHAILNGLIILLARPNNRHRSRRSTLSESYIQKKWGSRFRNFLCTKKRLLFYDWHFLRVDRIP